MQCHPWRRRNFPKADYENWRPWPIWSAVWIGALAAIAATGHWGGWYTGLAGSPAWATAVPPVDPEAARAFRNTALVTVTALLLGLVGAVLGGWLASGEPMSLTYYRRRTLDPLERPRRVA